MSILSTKAPKARGKFAESSTRDSAEAHAATERIPRNSLGIPQESRGIRLAKIPALRSKPRRAGRPTKRTKELTRQIAEVMALGLTDDEAAAVVGISSSTLSAWLKIREFSDAVKSAQAWRLAQRIQRIEIGAPGWQGTAWALERMYPRRFARPEVLLAEELRREKQGESIDIPPKLLEDILSHI